MSSTTLGAPRKAKTQRGKRVLESRQAKIHENEKKALFIQGSTCSQVVRNALGDLLVLKKPNAKAMNKKNQIHPFEDATSLEFFSRVNDASIFAFGSSSKKRPHTVVFGRTFDHQILDMLEFQIDPATFKSMQDFAKTRTSISRAGAKPMFAFVGDVFDNNEDMKNFRSFILDAFRGEILKKVNLAGLDRVIVVTGTVHPIDISKKVIYFRHYNVLKKKSGNRVPRVELEEVGPRMDLAFNRSSYGSSDIRKASMKVPRGAKMHLPKNVEIGQLGTQLGRLHMEKQDLNEIALAKQKGLGKRKNPNAKRVAEPTLSQDNGLGEQRSSKRSKTLPSAYLSSVISE